MRVEKADLLREIRTFQNNIRENKRRRERYVPKTGRKRPAPRATKAPEELGRLLLRLAQNLAEHGSWRGYSWKSDLIGGSLPVLLHAASVYDLSKGTSVFSYLTRCCWRAFVRELAKQKAAGMTYRGDEFPDMTPLDTRYGNFAQGAPDEPCGLEGW